jgi:hypothetical protein
MFPYSHIWKEVGDVADATQVSLSIFGFHVYVWPVESIKVLSLSLRPLQSHLADTKSENPKTRKMRLSPRTPLRC